MSDADIVKEFLVESYENLDRLDQDLIVLEKDPANRDTLASIFRTIHTIKGTSGFLAFNQLEAVTHAGESLLSRLRDGALALNAEITTALLAMVDAVREMLKGIDETGKEGERDDRELIAKLTRLLEPQPSSSGHTLANPTCGSKPDSVSNLGKILVQPGEAQSSDVKATVEQQTAGDPRHVEETLVEKGAVKSQDIIDALNSQQQARAGNSASDSTIRVDVGQLDRLMNRVGELVLLRNQIVQYTNSSDDDELLATSQRLNLLTTELQEGVMKTRMQPIGNIWSKFPRTVRDVAVGCGKQVRIEMEGKETELDKTIIEAIKDPLTHLVRNAVDHGIERPEARQAAGKNPEGRLFLRAFHEGGQVNIEVTDDGAGLDYEKIRNKAIQKALITADHGARMTEREVANLIFLPGFSTAEKVTNVSGRGVGMDVVKTNIEKIGGTVDLQSRPGQGSTVRMKIPLTLAIIPALIVTTAGDRYAIPQVSLLELVRLEGEQARKGLELANGAPVYRLRGKLLPLVYLNRELRAESSQAGGAGRESRSVNIVVLRADDRQFGLVVDEINDTEEIVVKPLSKQLKSINAYAGATIMGDGKVALILDVMGLAQRANVVGEVRDRPLKEQEEQLCSAAADGTQRNVVLLFQHGENGRMAIDLGLVARLEEFPLEAVEIAGDQEVVQYRGQIMPLVRVSQVFESSLQQSATNPQESLHVVVYSDQGRSVGLVVDRILDIVEESFTIQPHLGRKGIGGSAVIQKRVTDIIDVPGLIAAAGQSHALAGARA
ncbi:MAG TPA: chemotaxis protein CheA [Candidatus Sulfotelmatobacter sp.]|nr:chemotaxis protein CheA [Candidatus Sulfotelmatobacter sp.]